jgi:hypothetical protein
MSRNFKSKLSGRSHSRNDETSIEPTKSQLTTLENLQNIRIQDALDHEFNYYWWVVKKLIQKKAFLTDFFTVLFCVLSVL